MTLFVDFHSSEPAAVPGHGSSRSMEHRHVRLALLECCTRTIFVIAMNPACSLVSTGTRNDIDLA